MPDVVGDRQEDHNIGLAWYEAGCSIVPIQSNGTKRPTRDWSILQKTRLTRDEVLNYWRSPELGVAIICGAISGNLEMTELESLATDEDSLHMIQLECRVRGVDDLWTSLLLGGYAEWTPSGGIHLLYRIEDHEVPGNTKLAATATGKTLAETRGEGGYVIVAPSPGCCHPTGEPWTTVAGTQGSIPTITWSQRQAIHSAITAALDETPPAPVAPPRREVLLSPQENRPGDEFDARTDWRDILEPAGWTFSHGVAGGETFWTRPGKDRRDGHSASTGYNGNKDRLYVWSTDAGLPVETPLSKFFVYAHYEFGGNMSAAAKSLAQSGYGNQVARHREELAELDVWGSSEVALPGRTGFVPSETGNGHRMKNDFGAKFLFNPETKKWMVWTGGAWQVDRKMAVKQAAEAVTFKMLAEAEDALRIAETAEEKKAAKKAYDWAITSQSERGINAMVARFSAQPGVVVAQEDFDSNAELLNLRNGVLNLSTGEIHLHDPKYMMTMTFEAALEPTAQAPRFEQFMADVLPDEDTRAYVQRALGYTLLGKPSERAMFLLHGKSGTGKSVLTNVMTKLFGTYGGTAPAATFRIKRNESSLDLHSLRGKRFVATSEMPEGAQLDEELFKRVTGGDQVSSRAHYEEYQTWTPQCVVWIATNFLPRVTSDDDAIWRRAKTISMDTQFGGDSGRPEILGYADILLEEADGILNWLLAGLAAYRQHGLNEPASVRADIAEYRTDVDTVASFVRDMEQEGVLKEDPDGVVPSSVMLSLYDRYCQEQRIVPYGGMRFAQRLKSLGYTSEKVGGIRRWRGLAQDLTHGLLGTFG